MSTANRAASLLATIDRLYAATREASAWPEAVDAVNELVGAGHTILFAEAATDDAFVVGARVDIGEDDIARFLSPEAALLDGYLDLHALPSGVFVDRSSIVADEAFVRTECYNELIRPMNGFHSLFVRQEIAGGGFVLAVCRPAPEERFDPEELATLNALLPHLCNAVEVSCRLRGTERRATRLESVLDHLGCAILLVDGDGRPLGMNAEARRLLAEEDGLRLGRSGLVAASPADTQRLRNAIARAAVPFGHGGHDLGAAVTPSRFARVRLSLGRPSHQPPLLVTITPTQGLHESGVAGRGAAAVFVEDPAASVAVDATALGEAFKLTRREAEIARLVGEGHSPMSVARRLSLGIGTVRNHLKRVFYKTGVRSQASLVALARGYSEPPG